MKRIIYTLAALACIASLTACNRTPVQSETIAEVTTLPSVTAAPAPTETIPEETIPEETESDILPEFRFTDRSNLPAPMPEITPAFISPEFPDGLILVRDKYASYDGFNSYYQSIAFWNKEIVGCGNLSVINDYATGKAAGFVMDDVYYIPTFAEDDEEGQGYLPVDHYYLYHPDGSYWADLEDYVLVGALGEYLFGSSKNDGMTWCTTDPFDSSSWKPAPRMYHLGPNRCLAVSSDYSDVFHFTGYAILDQDLNVLQQYDLPIMYEPNMLCDDGFMHYYNVYDKNHTVDLLTGQIYPYDYVGLGWFNTINFGNTYEPLKIMTADGVMHSSTADYSVIAVYNSFQIEEKYNDSYRILFKGKHILDLPYQKGLKFMFLADTVCVYDEENGLFTRYNSAGSLIEELQVKLINTHYYNNYEILQIYTENSTQFRIYDKVFEFEGERHSGLSWLNTDNQFLKYSTDPRYSLTNASRDQTSLLDSEGNLIADGFSGLSGTAYADIYRAAKDNTWGLIDKDANWLLMFET